MARQTAPLPKELIDDRSLHNAIVAIQGIGGSTNAVIHLAAIAGRAGRQLDLDTFDRIGRSTTVLVDIKPSGSGYMEDFHVAGGVPALVSALRDSMALDAPTATGHPWSDQLTSPTTADSTSTRTQDRLAGAIRPVSNPIHPKGSIAVLRGNLCPNGAVIKSSAASKQLMTHKGPALVFQSLSDLHGRLSDPNLKVTAQHILVLRNAGPVGAPGMPEAGGFPIPKCLAERGVKDMVRISDARMSGTAFGTIVLHIAPEAAIGGPLALVRDGDEILLDVSMRRLELLVSEEELERRRQSWIAPEDPVRGYGWIYRHHVLGPDKGCDFDFLLPTDG